MAFKNLEIKVGLFVLTGIIVLAGSLFWLQGYRLKNNNQKVTVVFEDVGMLKVGDIITVSGVYKGKVSKMNLIEKGVMVELVLSGDVILKKDARFVIRNYGLMGDRFVAVYPGKSDKPFNSEITAEGKYDSGMPEVMGLMGEMVIEMHDLVLSFKRTVASDSTLEKFNRTVDNLESVTFSLSDYLNKNEAKLNSTVENFLEASTGLKDLVKSSSPKIDSTLNRFDLISSRLNTFVIRLDSLSISAKIFADRLENEDGTLQLMLEDRRLYDDLRRTADNIDDLILDIKENPGKYINLKFELF